jgi:CubicO group peptidase (beta-lactamase class C family)
MKQKALFLSFLFISSLHLAGQDKQADLKKYFSTLVKNNQFNGGVLVAENGKVVYEKEFGFANFSKKDVNNENTAFPIASLSKTLTATAILQLAQANKINAPVPLPKHYTKTSVVTYFWLAPL